MKPFLTTHKLRLTTVTPVHIGCGETLDPSTYTIKDNRLYLFDAVELAQRLDESERKEWAQAANDILRLQRFLKKVRNEAIEVAKGSIGVAPSIAKEFDEKLGKVVQNEGGRGRNVYNMLEIQAHIRSGKKDLYIPGSSIKGALKTAFFQHCLNKKKDPSVALKKNSRGEPFFDDEWFGTFENDIFSKLKLSDAFGEDAESEVVWCINRHRKKEDDDNTLSQRLEVLKPDCHFETTVTLLRSGETAGLPEDRFKSFPYDTNNFRIVVKNFYLPLLKKEIEWARRHENLIPVSVRNRMVRAYNDVAAKKGFAFKIGMHSGAEALTLEGIRSIKIPQARPPKWVDEPYTYWLASEAKEGKNASFMGWVYAEFLEKQER